MNRLMIARRCSTGLAALVLSCSIFMTGCGQKDADLPPPGTPEAAKLDPMTNNPPAGQPNHMSPEMQAQIDHMRSMGNQGGTNAAPAPAPAPGSGQ